MSNDGSPSDSFRTPQWTILASLQNETTGKCSSAASESNTSPQLTVASSVEESRSTINPRVSTSLLDSIPSHLIAGDYPSTCQRSQPSSSQHYLAGSHSVLSRRAQASTNHPLSRQISDSRIHAINAEWRIPVPLSEGRQSLRWSRNNGGSMLGSASGTCDWWSMQTFSELVASSRRERLKWTDASSPADFGWGTSQEILVAERIFATGSQGSSSPFRTEPQVCGLCSRLLTQKSSCSPQRVMGANDLSVVGVLVCGHVYHAECLEQTTTQADISDPTCPQCGPASNLSVDPVKGLSSSEPRDGLRTDNSLSQTCIRNKLSRIGVATDDITGPEFSARTSRHSNGKEHLGTEGHGGKAPQSSGSTGDKRFLSKSLSRKYFSFRGKSLKEWAVGDFGRRKHELPPQVVDSTSADDSPAFNLTRKGQSSSFRNFKRW